MSRTTHYDVLGIPVDADVAEVRRAYLAQARLLHPDRSQGLPTDDAARMARAMQEVNEAWRVLRAPASRAAYDARLAGRSVPGRANGAGPARWGADPDIDLDPRPYYEVPEGMVDPGASIVRILPWMVALVVLGVIFVFTAFAGGGGDDNRRSSSDLVGRCVQSRQGIGIVEVPCVGENEGRVDLVVSRQSQCPADTTVRAVPGESTWVCLRPAD
ncbi:MAG: J domain-containing protein [Acidimicrobiales bacterium]